MKKLLLFCAVVGLYTCTTHAGEIAKFNSLFEQIRCSTGASTETQDFGIYNQNGTIIIVYRANGQSISLQQASSLLMRRYGPRDYYK